MRRVIVWAAKLAVIGVLAMIGTGTFDDDAGQSDDSAKIQTYKAVFDVAKDGRTQVTETLQVEFPESKHGIFRFFDTWDAPNPKARLIPTNISVTRDGMVEPWELLTQDRGRFKVVKIGSPIVTMTGVHTYKISYQVEGALIAGGKRAPSLFYWDLIPGGWAMPIAKADLRVNLPAELSGERCIAGTGKYFACSIEADSATSLRVQASDLAPFVPVTVQAGVDIATPSVATKPWPSHLDPLFGKSVPVAFVVGLLALASGLAGLWLVRARSEKEPPFPLSYAPPEGISPGQAAYLLEEVLPTRAFIGSLLYAAERGAITMTQDGEKLVISTVGDGSAWDQLDVPTQGIAAMLSLKKEGATFTLDPKSAVASGKMQDAIRAFRGRVENWGKEAQLIGPSRLGVHGPWLLLATFVLTAALLLFAPWDMALLGLVPGLPLVPFVGLGAACAGVAVHLSRAQARAASEDEVVQPTATSSEAPLVPLATPVTLEVGATVAAGLRRLRPGGEITLIQRADRLGAILSALAQKAGAIKILPISARAGREAGRVIVTARKGARTPLRLFSAFILHANPSHSADGEDLTEAAQAVLREGAALAPARPDFR